nr:serine/threonine-protein kinase [Actinokineospora enzanensis]
MSTPETEQRLVAGRYRLRRQLGQGSMGTVWEAYDEFLRRPVAVKQVRLLADDALEEIEELRERTLREARAIAVVSHPNVITLHDVAREDDEPFVVMEFLEATSLAELIGGNGPLSTEQAAIVGHAVAAALQAAHAAGIVHRDVKPGNVLVCPDGRVKLTDFGIARNVSERTLTQLGVMLGSPCYIAPEVASGGAVTPQADLWGLGAALFAAVDGRAPYDPDAPVMETVTKVVNGEVPVPDYDGPLRPVILGLMVKDPATRMPLREVREVLAGLLPKPGSPVYESFRLDTPSPENARTVVTKPASVSVDAPTEVGIPLAAAPGPLPFTVTPPPRRGPLATVALLAAAVLLFLAATAGGFILTRTIGGQQILPQGAAPVSQQASAPLRELAPQTADAATLAGEQGGGFTIPIPDNWVKFVEQRTAKTLPNSTRVHWVSPDGTSEVVVERFPNFYPTHGLEQYIRVLSTRTPGYRVVSNTSLNTGNPEMGVQLTYRAVDVAETPADSGANSVSRTSIANILPTGKDLWVVSVTVPIEQEDTGRRGLFARIVPEFRVLGRN